MSTLMQFYLGLQARIARSPELANLEVNVIDWEEKEIGKTPKGFTPFFTADDNNFCIYVNVPQSQLDKTSKNEIDKLPPLNNIKEVYNMIQQNNLRTDKEIEEDKSSMSSSILLKQL